MFDPRTICSLSSPGFCLFTIAGFLLLRDDVDAVSRLVGQNGHEDRCLGGVLGKATLKVSVLFKDFTALL